jgi:SH3-like domain-containing protein
MKLKSLTFFFLFTMGCTSVSHALCVTSERVNLRAKPSGNSKVTWVVSKYMPLIQVDRKGAWIQVADVDNSRHWVHARNVSSRLDCVVIKTKVANLRMGPGSEYHNTDLGSAKKYATFKKLGRDEAWLKLQDDYGHVHWAHENTIWEPRSYTRVRF